MANKKISALNSVTIPLIGNEQLPATQNGVTKKLTVNNIKDAVESSLNLGSAATEDSTAFDAAGSASSAVSTHESTYSHSNIATAYNHSQSVHAPSDAEKNVNADWNATSGDAQILNIPTSFPPSAHDHLESVLKPDVVEYQLTPTIPTAVGSRYWDAANHTTSLISEGGTVLQDGSEVRHWCVNKHTDALPNGTMVRIVSAPGAPLAVSIASADSEDSSYILGMTTMDLTHPNGEGFVTLVGEVNGLNTNAYNEGEPVFLGLNGAWSTTKLAAPAHSNFIGNIGRKHSNQGSVIVNPVLGSELGELHNVLLDTTPADGDVLTYETATGLWKNKVASGGITDITTDTTLTGEGTVLSPLGVVGKTLSDYEYDWLYGQLPSSARLITGTDVAPLTATTDTLASGTPDYMCLLYYPAAGGTPFYDIPNDTYDTSRMISYNPFDGDGFVDKSTMKILLPTDGVCILKNLDGNTFGFVGEWHTFDTELELFAYVNANQNHVFKASVAGDKTYLCMGDAALNGGADYFEIFKNGNTMQVTVRNFLNYMNGQLAWTQVDKTGAGLEDIEPSITPSLQHAGEVVKVNAAGDGFELGTAGSSVSPATTVTTQAFGDSGVVGELAGYAREDHKHGMPSLPTSMTPTAHASTHIADTGSDPLHAYDVNAMSYHGWFNRDLTAGTTPDTVGSLPKSITTTTFTLYGSRSSSVYYHQGTKVIVSTDKTTTLSGAAGVYFIYFDGLTGDLLNSTVFPGVTVQSNVLIASVNWNGTNFGLVNDERHGYLRNGAWHAWAHLSVGCRWISGFDLTGAPTGTGATSTMTIGSGELRDEDIAFNAVAFSSFRYFYQTGATAYGFDSTVSTQPFYRGANNRPRAVNSTGYVLTQLDSATNRYINFFVYGTTDLLNPIYIFCETVSAATIIAGGYTSTAIARAVGWPSLTGFNLSAEMKPLYRIVVRADGAVQAFTSADDYRSVSSLPQSAGSSTVLHDATVPQLAGTGATYGHIDDTNQTIAGAKTFTNGAYGAMVDASGFNGNLATTDDTLQEIAQKFDDYNPLNPDEISITGSSTSTLNRMHNCSGAGTYVVQLPVVTTKGLISFRFDPALTGMVLLSTGADAVSKSGTVTGGTTIYGAGTGTISTSGNSTTVTGSGTSFTTQLRVGDLIQPTNTNLLRRVTAIASNTSLTIDTAATISSGGFLYWQTGILGSGTALSTDYSVGDGITISGLTRKVTWVGSATEIAVDKPFLTAPSASAHGKTTVTIGGEYYRYFWAKESVTLLTDGSQWHKKSYAHVPMKIQVQISANITGLTDLAYTKITFDTVIRNEGGAWDSVNKKVNPMRPSDFSIHLKAYATCTGNAQALLRALSIWVQAGESPASSLRGTDLYAGAASVSTVGGTSTLHGVLPLDNINYYEQYMLVDTNATTWFMVGGLNGCSLTMIELSPW